jgi:hypothetical protein
MMRAGGSWFPLGAGRVESGEEFVQAQAYQLTGGRGSRVVRPRTAGPAGLGGQTVPGRGAEQLVVAGVDELMVDVHGWFPPAGAPGERE